MLLTGKAGELAAAAKTAASAADSKSKAGIAILGTLLCDAADDNIIKFTGTDLDQAVTAEAAGVIEEPGRTAVPAEALSKLLAGIAADCEVTIVTTDSGMRVQAGRSRYQLPALPPDDFPQAPVVSNDAELVLTQDQMRQLFGATAFAISDEGTRYYLCGIYLHLVKKSLCAVATNGTMLTRAVMDMAPAPDRRSTSCRRRHLAEDRGGRAAGEDSRRHSDTGAIRWQGPQRCLRDACARADNQGIGRR